MMKKSIIKRLANILMNNTSNDIIRNVQIVTYYPFDHLISYFKELYNDGVIKCALGIAHDQDIPYHCHFNVKFTKPIRFSSLQKKIKSYMGYDQTIRYEHIHNDASAVDYLTHKNAPDKIQYSETKLFQIGNYEDTIITDKIKRSDINYLEMLNEIIDNQPISYMVSKYGRDYIINYEKYYSMAMRLKNEC